MKHCDDTEILAAAAGHPSARTRRHLATCGRCAADLGEIEPAGRMLKQARTWLESALGPLVEAEPGERDASEPVADGAKGWSEALHERLRTGRAEWLESRVLKALGKRSAPGLAGAIAENASAVDAALPLAAAPLDLTRARSARSRASKTTKRRGRIK